MQRMTGLLRVLAEGSPFAEGRGRLAGGSSLVVPCIPSFLCVHVQRDELTEPQSTEVSSSLSPSRSELLSAVFSDQACSRRSPGMIAT